MADKKFVYSGPISGVTLNLENGESREEQLAPGAIVSLPAEHPWVKVQIAFGRLTEPAPEPAAETRRTSKPEKGANP